MTSPVLTTLAATGFAVAFFHAALPTHWLPFVLVARARQWPRAKTLAVTVGAGLGHVALTTALGALVAWLGFQIDDRLGRAFPWIAGGVLLAIGLYYFWRQLRGGGICHHHPPGSTHRADAHCGEARDHSHWEDELKDSALVSAKADDWAAISGLFVMLTLSPCEGFLPVYLSAVPFGLRGFAVLSAILAVAALAGMTLFTWLALLGFEKIKVRAFERCEAALLGGVFVALGVLVVALER